MLNILLLILKIIGIILLIAVLLVVIVAAVVLFVPIRYDGGGDYRTGSKPHLALNATWILRILRARAAYEDGLHYEVSIFGKCILSSDRHAETTEGAEVKPAGALDAGAVEPADVEETGPSDTAEAGAKTTGAVEYTDIGHAGAEKVQVDTGETKSCTQTKALDAVSDSGSVSYYDDIQSRIARIAGDIKAKADAASRFVEDICEKADRLAAFLNDEGNKRAFKLLWKSLKHLLAHISPKKLKGHAILGFDDPSVTGYALAALSQLPVTWETGSGRKSFEVIPVFDRKVMDIDAVFRGRLKLVVPVRLGLKIWFNKDFKKLYAEVTDGRK